MGINGGYGTACHAPLSLRWLSMVEKGMVCVVRGYLVYKDIWAAVIREELVYSREPTNAADRYVCYSSNERGNNHWTLTKEDL